MSTQDILMVFGITSIGCMLPYVIITFLLYNPEKIERMATNQLLVCGAFYNSTAFFRKWI